MRPAEYTLSPLFWGRSELAIQRVGQNNPPETRGQVPFVRPAHLRRDDVQAAIPTVFSRDAIVMKGVRSWPMNIGRGVETRTNVPAPKAHHLHTPTPATTAVI
jgi:hypothetical protein